MTLKDIPDDLLERLRRTARAERRSLVQQALHLIDSGLTARERTGGAPSPEAAEQVRRWREIAGRWRSSESFEDEVEGIRDTRTAGREVHL